eukprot:gene5701-7869_t
MLSPTFTVKLGQPVLSGLVVVGKFDSKMPSLACGTNGGKILLHSPHEIQHGAENGQLSSIKFLNLNRKLTSIAAGSLIKQPLNGAVDSPDLIFVGTQSNLLAYDVERNADVFYVDVQDGVNSLLVGKLPNSSAPLVIAGGNCSVLGFDNKGTEAFWTVTGDNVSSMALCELDGNGNKALLVGSDDFEIRIFRNEEIIGEISEADRVTFLKPLSGTKFTYGLGNGTVGVYNGSKVRLWRVKTKHKVTALHGYDLDLDGVNEIFSGWSNGSYNVRREDNGEVIFKDTMDSAIASIVTADYRMDGKEEVMICSESGEVRAFLSTDVEFGTMFESGIGKDNASDQKALNELQTQKLDLLAELKLLEKQLKVSKPGSTEVGMLPNNTKLSYTLEADALVAAVTLKVEVNTDVQIVNLIAVDLESIVLIGKEVVAISPKEQSKIAILPLKPTKNSACTLRIQTHVATRSLGAQLHVFETDITIPRFSAYMQLTPENQSNYNIPKSKVTFLTVEPISKFVNWMQAVFILKTTPQIIEDKLKVVFLSVCDQNFGKNSINPGGQVLAISINKKLESNQTYSQARIHCDNMELVADLIQDFAKFFKLTELESEADFPHELDLFEEVLARVAECNSARVNLAADMADDSQRIKALIIRAEDSRLMPDMQSMRKSYTELNILNDQLISGYNIRAQNHENLLNSLKEVNQMIQIAANLRVGKAKGRVVTDCRTAVKNNNLKSLFRIIKQGYEPNALAARNG